MSIVVLAGLENVNLRIGLVLHESNGLLRSAVQVVTGMPAPRPPNPWIFVALSASSFLTFYVLIKYREKTNPASLNPRQQDHPLVPAVRNT